MNKIVFDVDPYTFTGSAVIIGFALVGDLSISEQNSVGNWLQLIGLVMETYSSQLSTLGSQQGNCTNNVDDLDTLKRAILKIQSELERLKKEKENL